MTVRADPGKHRMQSISYVLGMLAVLTVKDWLKDHSPA
jgi:hypothetical protein